MHAQPHWHTYLSWVEQIVRIDCLLDSLHELDGTFAELFNQIFALAHTNAVLARACALKCDCTMNHPVDSFPYFCEFLVVPEQEERMEVAWYDALAVAAKLTMT